MVMDFFHGLFENYGIDKSELERVSPQPCELVVPRYAEKPLVVVRGGYENVDPPSEEYDDGYGYSTWKAIGRTTFQLLTEPLQTGSFYERLSVSAPKLTGGGLLYPDEEITYNQERRRFGNEGKLKLLLEAVDLMT